MNETQLEAWIRQILSAVVAGSTVEDARVELKAELPAPDKAAHRLAGHANQARSPIVLWVVGVDEQAGKVPGLPDGELQQWLPQVEAAFDDLAPQLRTDLRVPWDSVMVSALLFDAARRPYVIREGDRRKVMWRQGTRLKEAGRGELLDLLVATMVTPRFETLGGKLTFDVPRELQEGDHGELWLDMSLYQESRLSGVTVIPYHRSSVIASMVGPRERDWITLELEDLHPELERQSVGSPGWQFTPIGAVDDEAGVVVAARQFELAGPTLVSLAARGPAPGWLASSYEDVERIDIEVRLHAIDAGVASVAATLAGDNPKPALRGADEDEAPHPNPTWHVEFGSQDRADR